jgi:hypothetical protein
MPRRVSLHPLAKSLRRAKRGSGKAAGIKRKEKTMSVFRGKTQDTPFLSASFWTKGTKIVGRVVRWFETENGVAYVVRLGAPVNVNGKELSVVALGALRGFEMALLAAGLERLQPGDDVHLECVGLTPTGKGSARVDFEIEVTRPDSGPSQITDDDVPF